MTEAHFSRPARFARWVSLQFMGDILSKTVDFSAYWFAPAHSPSSSSSSSLFTGDVLYKRLALRQRYSIRCSVSERPPYSKSVGYVATKRSYDSIDIIIAKWRRLFCRIIDDVFHRLHAPLSPTLGGEGEGGVTHF